MNSNEIMSLDLKPSEKLVLNCIVKFANHKNTCFPSNSTIAEETKLSVRTVFNAIKSLVNRGYISKVHRKLKNKNGFTSNMYILSECEKNAVGNEKLTKGSEKLAEEVTDLNNRFNKPKTTTPRDVVTSTSEQENTTKSDKQTEELQAIIQRVTGAKIAPNAIKTMIEEKGLSEIQRYLENWTAFQVMEIKNISGFFKSAVLEGYSIPSRHIFKNPQEMNYQQRTYPDSYYDSLVENVKGVVFQHGKVNL